MTSKSTEQVELSVNGFLFKFLTSAIRVGFNIVFFIIVC